MYNSILYTLCLLLIQCLQRGSGWCVLRWVNKLRPFFDANTGPCRDHYRFWPGLLLFMRLGLYLFVNAIHSKNSKSSIITVLCVITFILACVSPKGVYKKWPLNILEFSFFLNLIIVSAATSFNRRWNHSLGEISIGIAFFTFLLIVGYHGYKKISNTRQWKKMVAKIKRNRGRAASNNVNNTECVAEETTPLISQMGIPSIIDFTAPRERLLYDD